MSECAFSAAANAAYIHGRIASDWVREGQDIISLRPTDLLELLPKTIQKIRNKKAT